MNFQQKKMATHTWFTFEEKELEYRVRDNNGDVNFSIEYGSIPAASRSVFDRNTWLRNVGFIWCALGVINIGLALMNSEDLAGSGFWLMIGLGCLVFYRLTWAEFTVVDTQEGSIWVVKDDQHDDILAKITEKRKAELLAWYRSLSFEDDPIQEVTTIQWLIKQKAMTKQEGDIRIAEIREGQTLLLPNENDTEIDPKLH
ncbi:MAG: hypothetical protein DHS20C05_18070 [Hyphococcus sp.]|nr:MAG: hypothetical protein DHS20C05_18070 [Marinicaulis sp.]